MCIRDRSTSNGSNFTDIIMCKFVTCIKVDLNQRCGLSPRAKCDMLMSWALMWDFRWRLKLYRAEQVLIEVGTEFSVTGSRWDVALGTPAKISRHICYLDKLLVWTATARCGHSCQCFDVELSVCLSLCLCVVHTVEPCKNGCVSSKRKFGVLKAFFERVLSWQNYWQRRGCCSR